jgi:class 3 adenylate cyclase
MNEFLALLDRYVDTPPAERPAVEAEIWRNFGVECAILALDMSGFSLTVRRSGIVGYLGQIRRMLRLTEPVVSAYRGETVKREADNLLAVFASAEDALAAAEAINAALAAERTANPGPIPLAASIGLDFGKLLHIPRCDCFGDAVNVAYKLGEDLAVAEEILLTAAVYDRLPPTAQARLSVAEFSLSGLALRAWRLAPPSADLPLETPR